MLICAVMAAAARGGPRRCYVKPCVRGHVADIVLPDAYAPPVQALGAPAPLGDTVYGYGDVTVKIGPEGDGRELVYELLRLEKNLIDAIPKLHEVSTAAVSQYTAAQRTEATFRIEAANGAAVQAMRELQPEVEAASPQSASGEAAVAMFCSACHDGQARKGGFSLQGIDLASGRDQVLRGAMPPQDEPQPTDAERLAIARFLGGLE